MRVLSTCFFLCCVLFGAAQSDFLVIGRNLGSLTLPDSNTIRTFGFAEKLSENPPIPSATLHVKEGDSVNIDFWNVSQGAGHTIHLHGLDVDQANDGVPHLSFTVEHMEHGYYRFKAPHPGTYLYHCHVISSIHVQAGMYGMLIVHPKNDSLKTWDGGYAFEQDRAFLTSEIDTFWHQDSVLDQGHNSMVHTAVIPKYNPQFFLINGRASRTEQNKEFIQAKRGERVYIRLANLGNLGNHYVFPPDLQAEIVSSDGRPLPDSERNDSLWIMPGERYGILIEPASQFTDTIRLDYVDLNNRQVEGHGGIPVIISGDISIEEHEPIRIRAYPNPGSGRLTLQTPTDFNPIKATVYNLQGAVLQQVQVESGRMLDLTLQTPGLYLIQVISTDGQSAFLKYVYK